MVTGRQNYFLCNNSRFYLAFRRHYETKGKSLVNIKKFLYSLTLATSLGADCVTITNSSKDLIDSFSKKQGVVAASCENWHVQKTGLFELIGFKDSRGKSFAIVNDLNEGLKYGPIRISGDMLKMGLVGDVFMVESLHDNKKTTAWYRLENASLVEFNVAYPETITFMGMQMGKPYKKFESKFIKEGKVSRIEDGYASCFIDNEFVENHQFLASEKLAPFGVIGACALPLSKEVYNISLFGRFNSERGCIGTAKSIIEGLEKKYGAYSLDLKGSIETRNSSGWEFEYRIQAKDAVFGVFGGCSSESMLNKKSTGYIYMMDVERAVRGLDDETKKIKEKQSQTLNINKKQKEKLSSAPKQDDAPEKKVIDNIFFE